MNELSIRETYLKHRELLIKAREIESELIERINRIVVPRNLNEKIDIERIWASLSTEGVQGIVLQGRDQDNWKDSFWIDFDQLEIPEEEWAAEQERLAEERRLADKAAYAARVEADERERLAYLMKKYPDAAK